jgi:hypothetical protein
MTGKNMANQVAPAASDDVPGSKKGLSRDQTIKIFNSFSFIFRPQSGCLQSRSYIDMSCGTWAGIDPGVSLREHPGIGLVGLWDREIRPGGHEYFASRCATDYIGELSQ